jgi:thymidylate kinase
VYRDLTLHAAHNLMPARVCGHVVADRLTLSTACLLTLLYHGRVTRYLELLVTVDAARPELTVLLNTPTEFCMDRVRTRATARRFGDDPDTAVRLAEVYEQAADAWEQLTGQRVLRRAAMIPQDTDRAADEAIARLRAVAVPATGTNLGA